jgi:uncharacterized protein (DUF58 family)
MQVLDRKRVYILPSRAGIAFLGVIGLMLIGAINYDNALAFLLVFLLVGLLFTSMLHTWRNLAGLALASVAAEPVFAGLPARFALGFVDTGTRPRHALSLRRMAPRSGAWWWWWPRPAEGSGECATLATESMQILMQVPTARRGWLPLGRVEIATRYPLGLLRAWAYFDDPARCLVYPAPAGSLPLPGGRRGEGGEGGDAAGQDDFAGLRPYAAGDSLRSVHWKAAARGGELVVKQLRGAGGTHWLRWQDTAALGGDEARLAQLAQWVVTLDAGGARYGLELPELVLEPDAGPVQRARALRALALWPRA